jgi:hypothetical protein
MGTRAPHHSLAGASLGRQIGARGHRISYEGGGGSEIDRVIAALTLAVFMDLHTQAVRQR